MTRAGALPGRRRIIRLVKTLRVCVLVLMALLLPLRGVLAASTPCTLAGIASVQVPMPAQPDAGHHPCDDHAADDGHALPDVGAPEATGHHASAGPAGSHHGSGCQTGACCLMPLGATPPATVAPPAAGAVCYPALVAPPAAFQSGGQDRPPRAI